MNNKFLNLSISLFSLLFVAGCGQQTDEQILDKANCMYASLSSRYNQILDSIDDAHVIENSLKFGRIYYIETGWFSADKSYSDLSDIAPLHRAYYIMCDDIDSIGKGLLKLQRRMLDTAPVYKKIQRFKDELDEIISIILVDGQYSEEAKELEKRRQEAAKASAIIGAASLVAGAIGIACGSRSDNSCTHVTTYAPPSTCTVKRRTSCDNFGRCNTTETTTCAARPVVVSQPVCVTERKTTCDPFFDTCKTTEITTCSRPVVVSQPVCVTERKTTCDRFDDPFFDKCKTTETTTCVSRPVVVSEPVCEKKKKTVYSPFSTVTTEENICPAY